MNRSANNSVRFDGSDYEKYRDELHQLVRDVMAQCAVRHVIGISGGADPNNYSQAEVLVEEFVSEVQGSECAILTGGTEGGIPELGVQIAKRLNVPTVGVFPRQGRKYALLHDLDFAIETTPPDFGEGVFGTETPVFVNMLDGSAVVGGSYGTLAEAATILKTNNKRARDRVKSPDNALQPIYLVPLVGTGGVADLLPSMAASLGDGESMGMPDEPITRGDAAARFILNRLVNKTV